MIRAETQSPSFAFFAMTGGMSKLPDLKARLRTSGKSQVALAQYLGITKDSVGRLVNGQRKAEAEELQRALAFLDGEIAPAAPAFQQINVYGYAAAGGDDRIMIADDRVLDRIEVPMGLARGEIFGIRVAGDSMEPRLYSGEIVIVSRDLRPSRMGDCVVELRDGTALVKQYRGERDGVLFLHQYNPDQEVKIEASKVRAIHAVVYRR